MWRDWGTPKKTPQAFRLLRAFGREREFGCGGNTRKEKSQEDAERRVEEDNTAVAFHCCAAGFLQQLRERPPGKRAQRCRDRSRQRVPCKHFRARAVGNHVRKRSLFNGQ